MVRATYVLYGLFYVLVQREKSFFLLVWNDFSFARRCISKVSSLKTGEGIFFFTAKHVKQPISVIYFAQVRPKKTSSGYVVNALGL